MFEERFKNRLMLHRQAGLRRNPPEISEREGKYLYINNRRVLNFASNDYLGLGVSEELKEKVAKNFLKYSTSSSSSRLVSGNYSIINQAEKEYASFFGYDDALFFPSGYQANLGIISTFFEKEDIIIFDKHIHASSVKGISLSGANFYGYNHNSMPHLRKRLEANRQKQVAVLTESLFSMDGDFLDVHRFGELKREYGFLSIADEAHAFGAVGKNGCGIARGAADIAIGTFGKAFGLFGSFVLLPKGFKEYLFNFSSPLIYSTTLPEAHAASAIDLLKIISRSEERRKHLRKVSRIMKEGLRRKGFRVTGDAHILALEIGEEARAAGVSQSLLKKNIFVPPVRYPTVPIGRAILRISMTALHTEEDIRFFVDLLPVP
ncbi:MAG: pyridoxal phosphate-dependent aminotransferase family protein [Deltaproteobacteria bacterium]|nr:pyridoxal phosphate-dependent aminotransferase family protein [Deltaproteobacteria bacterium]MBW2660772.1 pyridoxal phosphate-dependent aminotransferase family protein [Deltaproteobacteria bacterium]